VPPGFADVVPAVLGVAEVAAVALDPAVCENASPLKIDKRREEATSQLQIRVFIAIDMPPLAKLSQA